jgi:HAD superfamily hydrolase (TIGR01549 family)
VEKIKLVIFDAGDVLFDSGMKHFNKMYYEFLKKHKREHLFDKTGLLWDEISEKARTGKITQEEANRRILSKIGINPEYVKEILKEDRKLLLKVTLYKETLPALKKLRKMGYKLAILTDVVWPKPLLKQFFSRLKLTVHTDNIFFSNVIGYAKPHRKSYLTVIDHFHVLPSETVFVGHSKDEMLGAKRIGLETIKFGNEKFKSIHKIKSLNELPKILHDFRA